MQPLCRIFFPRKVKASEVQGARISTFSARTIGASRFPGFPVSSEYETATEVQAAAIAAGPGWEVQGTPFTSNARGRAWEGAGELGVLGFG